MRPGKVTKTGQGLENALASLVAIHDVDVTAGVQGTTKTTAKGEAEPAELVMIATVNEYGNGHIPARPFMRQSVVRHGLEWVVGWDMAVRAATAGEVQKMTRTLRLIGVKMVGDIQSTLNTGPWVPNAPETVRRKSVTTATHTKLGWQPLVDTGQLKQSIRAQVEAPFRAPVVVG